MTTKPITHPNLASALIAAQKAFTTLTKSNTVDEVSKSGKRFSYKYVDLGSVLEAVTDALHENGLVVLQPLDLVNGVPVVRTILLHAGSGEQIEGSALVVWADKTDPQKFGGGITYTRRYALMSMLGLNAEDDDGQHARKPAPPKEVVDDLTGEIVFDASDRDGRGTATQEQRNRMFAIAKSKELNMTDDEIKTLLMEAYGTESTREISFNQMVAFTKTLDKMQQQARKAIRND